MIKMTPDTDIAALLSLMMILVTLGPAAGKLAPWSFDNSHGYGTCQGSGDVHVHSFDNWHAIDFQGPCLYTLTRLCCGSCNKYKDKFCPRTDFHVKVKNKPAGSPAYPLSYVDYVVVEICGYSVILDEGKWAVVETTHANYGINPFKTYSSFFGGLPKVWNCEGGTQFRLSTWGTNGIRFETTFMTIYNRPYFVKVNLSGKYRSKVCGLCGNFNGNAKDDLVTRDGVDASVYPDGSIWSVADTYVGNSWKVYNPGQPDCEELDPNKIPTNYKGKREVTDDPTALCRKYLGENRAVNKYCSSEVLELALQECIDDAEASNLVSMADIKEAICAAMSHVMANCPKSETRRAGGLELLSKRYGCYKHRVSDVEREKIAPA